MPMKRTVITLLIATATFLSGCVTDDNGGLNANLPNPAALQASAAEASTLGITSDKGTEALNNYNNANDLWSVLGHEFQQGQFKLGENEYNPLVQKQIDSLLENKATFTAMLDNARPYIYYIYSQIQKRHLPAELVLVPIIESGYNPLKCSPAGACGLWQFMPGTASGLAVNQNWWFDGRRDITQSTNAALNYFESLQQQFNGHWLRAVAAYDTGQGTVDNAMKQNERTGNPDTFWNLDLSQETEKYVPKMLALAAIIANPQKYGVTLPPLKNAPYLGQVHVDSQIDLSTAAQYADLSLAEFLKYNPGYNRWATMPDHRANLLLPVTHIQTFEDNVRNYVGSNKLVWNRYQIKPGNSLDSIAKKFHTSVDLIKQINNLKGDIVSMQAPLIIAENRDELSPSLISMVHQYMDVNNVIPGPKMETHIVKRGETLSRIAREYGIATNSLRAWNQIAPGEEVTPNMSLTIWSNHQQANPSIVTNEQYMVRRGDTLSSIASQYDTSIDAIKHANHMADDTISLGENLVVPVVSKPAPGQYEVKLAGADLTTKINYKVRPGDYLYKISQKFNVPVGNIIAWNDIKDNQFLHAGETLVIKTKGG